MGVHWWEWWSPGLQALGGIVELVGAALLAYEWWRAAHDPSKINKEAEAFLKACKLADSKAELDEYIVGLIRDISTERALKLRKMVYVVGFIVIVSGVIMQVGANAAAWAAAYGLLS
jgi:hypothetical protein